MNRISFKSAAFVGLLLILLAASIEAAMGRSMFGPDGAFGWWDGNIWGAENSQRVADIYSLTHFLHGIIFYFLLWLVARKLPVPARLLLAIAIEGAWEIAENSPIIIDRYRAVTVSLGYVGDSVLNSACDVVFMAFGFLFASRVMASISVATILASELFCLWLVRDNLALNIIMLIHPIESIRLWQSAGHL